MEFITDQFRYHDAFILDRLISEYARPNMIVFELGTYTGRSSLTMLPHISRMNGMLYCVDWFRGNPSTEAVINPSYRSHNILDIFLNNIRASGYEDYVTVLVGTTRAVVAIVADESMDFIFIDADHRYSYIRSDILNWYPKLKEGGLICGHDLDGHLSDCDYKRVLEKCEEDVADGRHYGVIRAVYEFFPDVKREGTIWYAKKGNYDRPLLASALATMNNFRGGPQEENNRSKGGLGPRGNPSDTLFGETVDQRLLRLFDTDVVFSSPFLVEEGYRGFNLVRYKAKFYALAQALGPVNLTVMDEHALSEFQVREQCVIANSVDEAKGLVDQITNPGRR